MRQQWQCCRSMVCLAALALATGVKELPVEGMPGTQDLDESPTRISGVPPPRAFLQEEFQDLPGDADMPAESSSRRNSGAFLQEDVDAPEDMESPRLRRRPVREYMEPPRPRRRPRYDAEEEPQQDPQPEEPQQGAGAEDPGGIGGMVAAFNGPDAPPDAEAMQRPGAAERAERIAAQKHSVMKQFMKRFSQNMRLAVLEDSKGDMPEEERRKMIGDMREGQAQLDGPPADGPPQLDQVEAPVQSERQEAVPPSAFLGHSRHRHARRQRFDEEMPREIPPDVPERSSSREEEPPAAADNYWSERPRRRATHHRIARKLAQTGHRKHRVHMLNHRPPSALVANAVNKTQNATVVPRAMEPREENRLPDTRSKMLLTRKARARKIAQMREAQRVEMLARQQFEMEQRHGAASEDAEGVPEGASDVEGAPDDAAMPTDSELDALPPRHHHREESAPNWHTLACDKTTGIGCNDLPSSLNEALHSAKFGMVMHSGAASLRRICVVAFAIFAAVGF